jgi:STE24 endopeptidase
MDESRKLLAKKYEKIKLIVSITESVISFILLILFIFLGYSKGLEIYVYTNFTSNSYVALIIFIAIIGLISGILSFPVDYIFSFKLEHKFGLSNQTFSKWILEGMKSLLVGSVIGLPVSLTFLYILRNYELWWLALSVVILIFSVLLAQIAPVLIFPLFYKFKPIDNESLKNKILVLCNKIGFKVKGVFTFDMSKNTKKANAAFTGLGKTKRIIISDTLLSGFSEDEIEVVFAHELGHYKKGHIKKQILISVVSTFGFLYLTSLLYQKMIIWMNFSYPWEIGALPILALITTIFGFLTKPVSSYISRKFEYEADRFAVETTRNIEAFKSMMEKLAFQNLADDDPNRIVEIWFHSHPSIKHRIEAVEKYFKQKKNSKE